MRFSGKVRLMCVAVALSVAALGVAGCAEEAADAGNANADTPAADSKKATTAKASGPSFVEIGSGDHRVPQDMKPGTYRTREASPGCYFEVLRDFSGDLDSIIANANVSGPAIVTIPRTAKGFSTSGCADWTDDLSRITKSRTSFGEGMYFVGKDIAPGSYRSEGGDGCYWARLSGFGGGVDPVIANDNASGTAIVEIAASDKGFESKGCGTWTK